MSWWNPLSWRGSKEERLRKKELAALKQIRELMGREAREAVKVYQLIDQVLKNPDLLDNSLPAIIQELRAFEQTEAFIESLDKKLVKGTRLRGLK